MREEISRSTALLTPERGNLALYRPRNLRAACFQGQARVSTSCPLKPCRPRRLSRSRTPPRWPDRPGPERQADSCSSRDKDSSSGHALCLSPKDSCKPNLRSKRSPSVSHGRSGPKSAGCRMLQLCLIQLPSAAGARVPSTTVVGGGLRSSERGKQHGVAPRESHNPGSLIPKATKRAFRRARNRAAASLEGGTFYKGRWHTRASLQALVNSEPLAILTSRPRQQIARPHKSMDVRSLCWNVGGLSGSCFQELVAWLDVEGGCYDVIILQETHWRASSDFRSGQWMCVHSSGYDSELSLDRYGGILIMINQDAFQEPAAHEIYPGRLLHVRALHRRSRLNVDIIGIYQHVYRPQLTPDLNQQYRSDVWTKLSTALQALPSRNPLLLGGDFNSQLAARRPHVGCSLLSGDGQQGDKQLHKLLEKCDLCVLNSWHAKPGHTYESTTSRTRIDFVVTKLSDAKGPARYAKPKYNFPIKAYSLAGHWPIEATIAVVPFNRRPPAKPADCVTFQRDELLVHTRTNSERAQALQQDVASRLAQVQPSSLQDARAIVNQVLLETAAVHFPPEIRPDSRISAQDSFRASAKTTWQFYRALKAPCIAVTHGIFLKWKAASDFSKASRCLRDQSRLLKRESLLRKLAEAEQAAAKGDQRVLHQIVRGLAPRCQKLVSRLRDPQGQLLGKDAALQAMLNYAKDTFCILPDEPDIPAMQDSWQCTDQDVQRELQKLGVFKAVPAGIAPAALWRCCAGAIAPVLGNSLRHHFQAGSTQCLQDELHDAYITLVPKPQKPAIAVENLRPIGLQCPSAKLIAGLLRQSLLEVLLPLITNLPQYAYAKHRGTFDALLRVHLHFEDASVLLRTNRVNRFQQHSGRKQHACVGGLSLSLDLSRAYDLTSRPIVYGTLAQHGVTQDTITIIKQLHRDAQYIFRSGDTTGGQPTTNGLKQGCCIAPFLWSFYTIALMHALQDKLGPQWLQKTLVLFADDHWCHWLVKNKKDWDDAINELVVVLETLTTFKMSINYRKTAILVRLEGKQAKAILHEHTRLKNGVRHLVITVHGEEQLIPVKDEHEYLGTKVTYQHRLDKNLAHRVQAGQAKYIALRKPLNGKHHLTIHHRTRLWLACVSTSMLYSLSAVGITKHGLERLTKACTKHLRAIQKQPAHVTRIPNRDIWTQAGLDMPGSLLLTALQRFQQNLLIKAVASPDITTQECILAHVQQLVASLQALIAQQAEHDDAPPEPETPQIPCPECDAMFVTENAMRIHCQVAHKLLPPRAASTPVKFVPRIHACGGLPRCQLCLRSFYRWQNLRVHIESGACEKLGGESLSKHPISATDAQVADNQLPVPAVAPDDAATGTQQNVPLIDRALFRNRQHDWESLLREPQLRIDLQTHCSLCHMWVASFTHIKQHIVKIHEGETPGLHARALTLCHSFKSQLVRNRTCPWCKRNVGAPGRHSQQCVVLYQLCIARIRYQWSQDRCSGTESGGGHLRLLRSFTAAASRSGDLAGRTVGALGDESTPQTPSTRAQSTVWSAWQAAASSPGAICSEGPPLAETAATNGPAESSNGQAHAAARGDACSPTGGQSVHHVYEAGLCQHHPEPAFHLRAMAQAAPGQQLHIGASIPAENIADGVLDQGDPGQDSENGLHQRRPGQVEGSRMDERDGGLDIPALLSPKQENGPRCKPRKHESSRNCAPIHISVGAHEGRDSAEVQQYAVTEKPGSERELQTPSHFRPRNFPTGRESQRDARDNVHVDWKLGLAACGHLPETGNTQEVSPSGAVGSVGVRPLTSVAHAATVRPRPNVCSLPNFSLHNPGNHCYAIAFLYALDAAVQFVGLHAQMPNVFQRLQGQQRGRAFGLLGFTTLGWQAPERQHDTCEFIDFVHSRLLPRSLQGVWQGRRQVPEQPIACTEPSPLSKCIGLLAPPKHSPNIQDLVNHWSAQEHRQAMVQPMPWLFLQLPRFHSRKGRIRKTAQWYDIPRELEVPLFLADQAIGVRWLPYKTVAVIRHHGNVPSAGHYTVALPSEEGFTALDDAQPPKVLDSESVLQISRDMYVLVIARVCESTDFSHDRASALGPATTTGVEASPPGSSSAPSAHGSSLAEIHRYARRGIGGEPHESPEDPLASAHAGPPHLAAETRHLVIPDQATDLRPESVLLPSEPEVSSQPVRSGPASHHQSGNCGLIHGQANSVTAQDIRRFFARAASP